PPYPATPSREAAGNSSDTDATTHDPGAAPAPYSAPAASSEMHRSATGLPHGRTARGAYFQVSSGVMASHLVRSPDPAYPMLARLAHVQGQVILQAVISTDGEVVAAHVLSGHRLLRGAASSAVRKWRYRPFLVDGRPVNVATIVTVDFHNNR
ncbi:MAG: energy transducer TonB, partial [Acidobacteriota bacterium]|nr:energy transducer TonB [Acidobacteriota bacterium]